MMAGDTYELAVNHIFLENAEILVLSCRKLCYNDSHIIVSFCSDGIILGRGMEHGSYVQEAF